ncbi:F0F1 ATP synthase subunit A [Paracoccus sp. SSK6]|uniref:F0F1 ATP synthase subunit A n=1 Tax=Paracoccus sp. SSK6 TaxID=3143131 RepID=UPI00321C38D0
MATEAHGEATGLSFHPMDQFIVRPLFSDGPVHWYTPSNVTLWLFAIVLATLALLVLGTRGRAIVPNRSQSMAEMAYGMIHKMVGDIAGKDGLKYFPYIMTLFMFVVFANFLGLLPMAFTVTSHIAVTGVLALAVFLTVTAIGFIKNGAHFLDLFWVRSAPLAIRPVLAVIEVISYFVRPLSLSIRLAGNMIAGHAVIKVFAGFAALVLINPGLGALVTPVSILAVVGMYAFEILVAFIQAYVFTILTCVYLKDALHPSH